MGHPVLMVIRESNTTLFSVLQDDVTLDDIRKTERNRQPPDEGIMCELLWSDPQAWLPDGYSQILRS